MLLEVISESKAKTRVHADGILYHQRNHEVIDLCAISMVGPEGAIRAIASDCSLGKLDQRPRLLIAGSRRQIRAKWRYGWSARAIELVRGAWHMVAVAKTSGHSEAVIIPSGPTTPDVEAAIYRHLRDRYSTPLLPIGKPGQPAWERALAEKWRTIVVRALCDYRKRRLWTPLEWHTDQETNPFAGAGLLTVTQAELDSIVSNLARKGVLEIPDPAKAA